MVAAGSAVSARQTHSSPNSLKAAAIRLPVSHPISCSLREIGITLKGLLKAELGEVFNVCGKGELLWPEQFEHLQCETAQRTGEPTA